MAICRKPGALVERVLESDMHLPAEQRGTIVLRVPNEFQVRELLRLDGLRIRGNMTGMDGMEVMRTRFGMLIESWRNLFFDDGSAIQLERDEQDRLTPRCFASIVALSDEIMGMMNDYTRCDAVDRKNS